MRNVCDHTKWVAAKKKTFKKNEKKSYEQWKCIVGIWRNLRIIIKIEWIDDTQTNTINQFADFYADIHIHNW